MKGITWVGTAAIAIVCTMVVVVIASQLFPTIRYAPFSPCWGIMRSHTDEIYLYLEGKMSAFRIGDKYEHEIKMGDCVTYFLFVNKDTVKKVGGLESKLKGICPPGEAYMIVSPKMKEATKWWNLPAKAWEEVKSFWKDLGGIEPICYPLNKTLVKDICIKGPSADKPSCELNLTFNIGDKYDLEIESTCEECKI